MRSEGTGWRERQFWERCPRVWGAEKVRLACGSNSESNRLDGRQKMRRSIVTVWSAALLLGPAFGHAQLQNQQKKKPAATPAAVTPAAKLQGLDGLADQAMKEWKVPGVAIAVLQDGKVIYAKGYGYRDVDKKLPVTTGTPVPIGSITKSFTALTFAILKDEGKVDWDQPVRKYCPEV